MVGALLLWISNNFLHKMPLSPVDALFLSTSAVCVTGLSSINFSSEMGLVSQIILLALVQIGGLGFMTAMMFLSVTVGRRIGIKSRMFFLGGLGVDGLEGAIRLLKVVLKFTFFFEAIGASILFIGFITRGLSIIRSLYYAVFHSVSAFCNAGFSPIPNGLQSYANNIIVPGTIMSLIILGGIGFPVFAEIFLFFKSKRRLSHYAKLVIIITASLLLFGTLFLSLSEWRHAFKDMPIWSKLWNGLFASVTARTAGFDTVSYAKFSNVGQIITILLMVIGASPSSTGGGIKTTTLAILAISVWNELHGRSESIFMHRKIPYAAERRALALLVVYVFTFIFVAVILTALEGLPFGAVVFETASAIGTVGLSVGITPEFSSAGKILLVFLMFWGRVGILSFFTSLVTTEKASEVHYSDVNIPIG